MDQDWREGECGWTSDMICAGEMEAEPPDGTAVRFGKELT